MNTLTVEVVGGANADKGSPENEYLAFTIAKADGRGGYKATQSKHVHYANVDTGA